MTTRQQAAEIRRYLGHGIGDRVVRVHGAGVEPYADGPWVEYYGSTEPLDRQHDYWHYAGRVDQLLALIEAKATR